MISDFSAPFGNISGMNFRHEFFRMDFRQDMNEDIGGIVVTKTFNFLIFAFHGKLGNPGDAIHSVSELTIRLRDYLM